MFAILGRLTAFPRMMTVKTTHWRYLRNVAHGQLHIELKSQLSVCCQPDKREVCCSFLQQCGQILEEVGARFNQNCSEHQEIRSNGALSNLESDSVSLSSNCWSNTFK